MLFYFICVSSKKMVFLMGNGRFQYCVSLRRSTLSQNFKYFEVAIVSAWQLNLAIFSGEDLATIFK